MTLIPEQRPDKTGKMVTRHVRALSNEASTRKPLPYPATPAMHDHKQRAKDAIASIYEYPYEASQQAVQNLEYLASNQAGVLERIVAQAESGHELKRLWQNGVKNCVMEKWFSTGFGADTIERDLVIYPMCVELIPLTGDHGNNPGLTMEYTRTVEYRVRTFSDDRGQLPIDMCKALTIIGITRGIYADRGEKQEANKDFTFDQVMSEAEYIARNIDRVEPIAAELVRRGNHEIDFVESLLSVQKPLMEGAL